MQRTLLLLIVFATGAASAFAQQAPYRAPRTDTGQPDLQGVWNFSSDVPLQRPPAVAGRTHFTREELEAQAAAVRNGLTAITKLAPVEAVGLDWFDNAPRVDDLRTSLITYPADGRLPALVAGVRRLPGFDELLVTLGNPQPGPPQPGLFAAFASFLGGTRDSYTDFMPSERCLIDAQVPMVPQLDGNFVQIVQGSDHVVLITDFSRRVVALGAPPPRTNALRHWTGISIGRWEGDTLVVETRNFNDRTPSFGGAGNSLGKVVTERFTRSAEDRIVYTATVVDPQTFQDRIELSFPMAATDARIYEAACHEGNYSMRHALAAARLDDEARKVQRQRGPRQQLTVFDQSGAVVTRIGEPGLYAQAAFSPDASQVAVIRTDIDSGNQDVWTFEVATGRGRAITADPAVDSAPLWSPDGKSLAYASVRDNVATIFRRAADGSGEEALYRHDAGAVILTDWSRDGRFLTFWSGQSLFVLSLTGDRRAVSLGDGRGGRFSPDGRLLAYNTNEPGQAARFHAFVRPFDVASATATASAAPRQVSQANAIGGIGWRNDGKELYFLSQPPGQTLMAVDLAGSEPSPPRALFPLPPGVAAPAQLSNISSPDGQRFVFAVNLPAPNAQR